MMLTCSMAASSFCNYLHDVASPLRLLAASGGNMPGINRPEQLMMALVV
jgi:hypothetical protein